MQIRTNIPYEQIRDNILEIRGQKILLDSYLAQLYQVETKQLKRQVKRNIERFPEDFMFELSVEEIENLRCQIGTSSWGGTRYAPMAFTEQGIAMLSSVLSSPIAIQVNIQIIRAFTYMRRLVYEHEELLRKVNLMELRLDEHDEQIVAVLAALRELLQQESVERPLIGFKRSDQERPNE